MPNWSRVLCVLMVKLGDIQFLINPLARKEGILDKRKVALRWAAVVNKLI